MFCSQDFIFSVEIFHYSYYKKPLIFVHSPFRVRLLSTFLARRNARNRESIICDSFGQVLLPSLCHFGSIASGSEDLPPLPASCWDSDFTTIREANPLPSSYMLSKSPSLNPKFSSLTRNISDFCRFSSQHHLIFFFISISPYHFIFASLSRTLF